MKKQKWQKPHVVYLLMCLDEVVYVGCTQNLKTRLRGHQYKVYTHVISFDVENQGEGSFWERRWLIMYTPKYNWLPEFLKKDENISKLGVGRGISA